MLLLTAAIATLTPLPSAHASARVAVRIVAPARASERDWKDAPAPLRRETVVRGESGEPVSVRLIEYQ
jgi:hypothetical protein